MVRQATREDRQLSTEGEGRGDGAPTPRARPIPIEGQQERQPLKAAGERNDRQGMTRYGSIIGSPPDNSSDLQRARTNAPSLKLPGPALGPRRSNDTVQSRPAKSPDLLSQVPSRPNGDERGNAFEVGKTRHAHLAPRYKSIFQPKRVNSMPGTHDSRPLVKRMLSIGAPHESNPSTPDDIALDAYREVDFRQTEFFMFLDREMEKIEDFYKMKEDEATERLKALREQLHVMRDKRLEEVLAASRAKANSNKDKNASNGLFSRNASSKSGESAPMLGNKSSTPWLADLTRPLGRAKTGRIGKTSKAMEHLGTPSGPRALDEQRDYTRRPGSQEVPYRTAKRKLKIALAEYYRGLELLKSYALLNRTAFRKINKKFDKTVNARPSGRYMSEKVNKAHFVNSEVIDSHIQAVEDLYARYFERGNHKIAVGKLRAKAARPDDFTDSIFRNGLMVAGGLVFGIEGLTYGAQLLFSNDSTLSTRTSYLLQVCSYSLRYAGISLN